MKKFALVLVVFLMSVSCFGESRCFQFPYYKCVLREGGDYFFNRYYRYEKYYGEDDQLLVTKTYKHGQLIATVMVSECK